MTVYTARVNEGNEKGFDYTSYLYGWSHTVGWVSFGISILGTCASLFLTIRRNMSVSKLD